MIYNKSSKINGFGLFTDQTIKKGKVVTLLKGKIILTKEHEKVDPNAVQVGPDLFMLPSGEPDDFTNHSCNPNSEIVINMDKVYLKALRDIQANEEITFDYCTTIMNDSWQMNCHCGSKDCRKIIKEIPNPK